MKKFSGTKLSWTLTCNLKMWDFFSIWEIICILIFHSSWSGRFDFFECREILTKWSTTTWRLQTQRKLWSISITIDPVNLASEAEVKGNSSYEFCMYLLLHFHAVCTMHNTSFKSTLARITSTEKNCCNNDVYYPNPSILLLGEVPFKSHTNEAWINLISLKRHGRD